MPDPRCAAVRHEARPRCNPDSLADARSCRILAALRSGMRLDRAATLIRSLTLAHAASVWDGLVRRTRENYRGLYGILRTLSRSADYAPSSSSFHGGSAP